MPERLLREGICTPANVPSIRQIQTVTNKKLGMTQKKLTSIPSEYTCMTTENLAKVDDYLNSGYQGQPAIEVQRYASNANYTVNLMHSIFGVDYFNTISSPSNGQELLNFFHGVLDMQRDNGVRIILPGDAVIMDTCGFHHGRITERLLIEICWRVEVLS